MTDKPASVIAIVASDEKELRRIGRALMSGALSELLATALLIFVVVVLIDIGASYFGLRPADDCDVSVWQRCGMRVLTDHKTGIQYLMTPEGALIERGKAKP